MFIAPLARVVSVNSGSLQLLVCASSDDLTNRTGEVSWGNLQKRGRDPFDIPLRGRSTRSWLIGINSWITWAGRAPHRKRGAKWRCIEIVCPFRLGLPRAFSSLSCFGRGRNALEGRSGVALLLFGARYRKVFAFDTERYLRWIPGNLWRLCGDACLHSWPCRLWYKQDVIQHCAYSLAWYRVTSCSCPFSMTQGGRYLSQNGWRQQWKWKWRFQ